MFYYQQLFNQAMAGIDRTSLVSSIVAIAYVILTIGFLIGMYQAALRGGDVRSLGVTALKFLVVGIVLANWSAVFHQVNDSANALAKLISDTTGSGDTFTVWLQQLKQQYDAGGNQSFGTLVTETVASTINVLLIFVAYILYPSSMLIFSLFYSLYGAVLYVVGPLVVALMPSMGLSQMSKSFVVNVMVWNSWGILYAIFGALLSVINADQINSILSQKGFIGFFQGVANSTLLGLISIFYALCLALIPFIAKRVISGDVGETMFTLARTAGSLVSGATGMAGGAAGLGLAAGAGYGSAAGGGGGGESAATTGAGSGSSVPPTVPSMGETISSGFQSAVGASSAPGSGSENNSSGGDKKDGGGQSNSKSSSSSTGRSGSTGSGRGNQDHSYRPHGVAQFLAFHAGRAVGQAVKSNQNNSEQKGSEEKK